MNKFLTEERSAELVRRIQESGMPYEYDEEKHRLVLPDETNQEQLYFRLPITLPKPGMERKVPIHYVILLIQSGNCALGYFENGRCLDHKVYRSYMVRKKQGKSQIKYLKTKGKSRAGSRVRLGETVEFFENINGRLQEYFEEHEVHRIAISCSKTLIPFLFSSKAETPFTKQDARLYKIPRHVHTPIYEVLLDTNRFLLRGELIFDEAQQHIAEALIAFVNDDTVEHEDDTEEAFWNPDDETAFPEDWEEQDADDGEWD